jgi:hypothetical protein
MAATKPLSLVETDSIGAQGSSPELDSNRTLDEIVRSAQHATGASGAALVLSDGEIMSCRACSGELAPPVGTRLNTDSGFTASCVQTADVVRCDDTQTDPRVDGSSCIEQGIRSILAVPVCDRGNVAGVLEVLSTEPKKFTDRHAKALQLLARLIETLVDYASRGEGSASLLTLDAEAQETDSAKATTGETKLTCLSCGHPNPSDGQFCTRCGVILLSSPGSPDTRVALIANDGMESNADEGLKQIYKLISGNGGLATWNEIYARLLGNLQSASRQEKPPAAAGEKIARQDDTVVGFGSARGATELKSRLGAAIRQNLWL